MPALALLPGLYPALLLACASLALASLPSLAGHGVSALTLAMLGGVVLANIGRADTSKRAPGLAFCKRWLLRSGIVLFGLQLTLSDIAQLGGKVLVIDALVLISTFALAQYIGRYLGLDKASCILIGAGSAICGAAAVMATQPLIRADGERASIAVAGVVLFGSVAMLLYPWLYSVLAPLGLSETAYGIATGSTMHEVAQVVAAGKAVGDIATNSAVISKMLRVMMLAPFLLLLGAWWQRSQQEPGQKNAVTIPWFAIGFLAVIIVNSSGWLPAALVQPLLQLDKLLLATAMAALGLDTRIAALRAAGLKPMLLAGILFIWLLLGGGSINYLITYLAA